MKTIPLAPTAILLVLSAGFASADLGDQFNKISASDGAAVDMFGFAVAMDTSVVVVGAPNDDDLGVDSGSTYLFDLATGTELLRLSAPDGAEGDGFGFSVAVDGTTVVIGAPYNDDMGAASGSAYLFDVNSGAALKKLLPSSGQTIDNFGWSVAISGAVVLVGARNAGIAGSVYVFDASTGLELAELAPDDGSFGDEFGTSVAISGNLAVIGSPDHSDSGTSSGSVYVFDVTTGLLVAQLLPDDGVNFDDFGQSVAISGSTILVGAPFSDALGSNSGAAYLFDALSGSQAGKLLSDDGGASDFFGMTVSMDGQTAIVGSEGNDGGGSNEGAAYVFDTFSGLQIAKLQGSDASTNGGFGDSVAISAGSAVVGAGLNFNDNGVVSGTAYLFDTTNPAVPASATIRNGSGLNNSILSNVTDPVLGTDWETDVDTSGHSASLVTLVVFEQASDSFFLGGGELLVDLSSPPVAASSLVHSGGSERFSISVPADASLFGFLSSAQAVVFGAPGYELSNALDLVLGF